MAFLTCAANGVVGAVHPKAMPVMLRPGVEVRRWLERSASRPARLLNCLRIQICVS
jgi:putative SOS response-associated peptidase YedK